MSLFADARVEPDRAAVPSACRARSSRHPISRCSASRSIGRLFSTEEDRVDATPVAIISHGLWQRRFGATPDVAGQDHRPRRTAATIVGVAPPGFRGLSGRADMWRPLKPTVPFDLNEPCSHSYTSSRVVGPACRSRRLTRPSVCSARRSTRHSRPPAAGQTSGAAVPLDDERIDPVLRRAALVLLGAVGLVLLIACVNLANLTLARGLARQREVAIRLALGASRLRIVRQFLTESLCLSLAGAAPARSSRRARFRRRRRSCPTWARCCAAAQAASCGSAHRCSAWTRRWCLMTVGLAVVSAMLFGLVPAWQATRGDLTSTTKP